MDLWKQKLVSKPQRPPVITLPVIQSLCGTSTQDSRIGITT